MIRAARLTLLAGLALLGVAGGAGQAAADSKSERLETMRREIEAREANARKFRSQAEGYLGELEGVDRELVATRASLKRLRHRQRAADEEYEAAQAQVAEAARALDGTRKDLEARLIALYKFASTGGVASLYAAGDFQSFARSRQDLARILDRDRELFDRHRARRIEWEASRDRSRQLRDEIDGARREVALREDRVRRQLVERRNLVDMLRTRSDREQHAAEELRDAARRLEQALSRMPDSAAPSAGKGLRKGAVSSPVPGDVRLAFGRQVDREYGTETLRNGIEIDAPVGTPVEAVAAGRVLFAGWFRGYGQMVIVDHGDQNLTVSGYLQDIAVEAGADVRSGQEIGSVGDTGTTSEPGLYFEIRHRGKPVDPRDWLRNQAEAGTK